MSSELARPGVEVLQVFRSVSPTIVTPTLVPCIVGVAKQVVEVLETTASGSSALNSDALIQLAGGFQALDASGDPAVYTGLDGLDLVLSINLGADVTITFSDSASSGLSPASVVSQILDAFTSAGVTAATAQVVGDSFRVVTLGTGEFQNIRIQTGTDVTTIPTQFGIGVGQTYSGLGNYNQYIVSIPQADFPDPNNNLDELAVESSTIRVFLATGNSTSLQEASRTAAFCQNGTVDDASIVTGNVDITSVVMGTETLVLYINGSTTATTVTFSSENGYVAILGAINAVTVPLGVTATVDANTYLVLTSTATGPDASIKVDATSTSLALLGLSGYSGVTTTGYSIAAIDDGNGDAVTPLIQLGSAVTVVDFTATPTACVVTTDTFGAPSLGETLILSDGRQAQTVVFDGTESTSALAATAINAVIGTAVGGLITAADNGGEVELTHSTDGTDSYIEIIGGTAAATLGFTVGVYYATVPSSPEPGDELWIDGVYYATITEVGPGADDDVVKVDKQVAISDNIGRDWFIVATNLPSADASRPAPELSVDLNGMPTLKQELLRDSRGNPVDSVAPVYLSYRAVRLDVSPSAARPGLLRYDNTTTLEEELAPLSIDNPLGLGLFFALLNAPGVQVTGLGVGAISADSPYGTVEAFTAAAEYLEAFEVYAIAPMTHDETVAQVFNTHVTVMSGAEEKGERIVLWNPEIPTNELDTLVASGTNGNSVGATGLVFDTGIPNLTSLVQNAGIDPIGTIPADEGLYLDIASDAKQYSIASISGAQVTIRTSFATGENDDNFYATSDLNDPPLSSSLIEEAFTVKIRGASLTSPGGSVDKDTMASTIAAIGQTYLNRRFWMTVPDQCAATLGGLEQTIEGFYMNAAIAGMIGQNPPQQSFTNYPMTGFTQVIGSQDYFSARQMNVMAAGGAYIIVQDAPGAPLISRMALTTNMTSVETRTDSITKVVDFTAKFLRGGLKNFIGRFNITQGFLDSLGTVINGMLGFLVENGVLIGGDLNNIVQDEDSPDTVLVDITLDVPYPCNYIRLTLVV